MRSTKKIDWLNHFLEFIVVVIGILLAFQLNTCSEDKKESALVEEHIQNIIEETEFNKRTIVTSLSLSEDLLKDIDSILMELRSTQDITKINQLSFKALSINPLYLKKTAYNSLKESGDIRFIDDFNLKNDIITIYEYYEWADGVDEMTLSTYRNFYFPYLIENFDMLNASNQEDKVYLNKKFANIMSSYRYALYTRIMQNKQTIEKMEAFIKSTQAQ